MCSTQPLKNLKSYAHIIPEQESPVIQCAYLTEVANGPDGDDKLFPRPIPEDGVIEEFNPEVGSADGTEP